ncbi:MAG: phosphohistidine phosphatase SixA [Woeseiaceae bacterium]|nr:phosphohistidine phosphatase SixA [Woeseiaceae bacterium]
MRLFLVQHGDAVPADIDPERPLSDKGRADIRRLAERLRQSGVRVERILHSGKLRAMQTAEMLSVLLAGGGSIEARDGLAPNDPPQPLLESLGDEDLLLAGHMPFVSRVVSIALGVPADRALVRFQPGSVAVLERGDDAWSLVAFIRPEHA